MSEAHATKVHPVPTLILLAVICVLIGWGIGLMNDGGVVTGLPAAVLLFAFGAFAVLVLGRPDSVDA